MHTDNPLLPLGYSSVPDGYLVNVATSLQMLEPAPPRPAPSGLLRVERWHGPSASDYRDLYRHVGQDWLWATRLSMSDEAMRAILDDPLVEVFVLTDGERRLGLLELDFRQDGECEIAYFGVVATEIGQGSGRLLMNAAITQAWARPIHRLWVHTCNFDHPAALAFYQRSGFRPYAFSVEVFEDPRLSGIIPRDAAPHVPLIDQPSA